MYPGRHVVTDLAVANTFWYGPAEEICDEVELHSPVKEDTERCRKFSVRATRKDMGPMQITVTPGLPKPGSYHTFEDGWKGLCMKTSAYPLPEDGRPGFPWKVEVIYSKVKPFVGKVGAA
jgi:hypothetical protein